MVQNQRYQDSDRGTLIMLLKEEIDELQQGVMEMREEALVKNVAKRKVDKKKYRLSITWPGKER
jgi:hypothetical protein